MGYEIVCLGRDVRNTSKYIWEEAYSEARRERNPEMVRSWQQAEIDYIDSMMGCG